MRITIVGGGNIGTAMCAEFAHNGHRVKLLTSNPQEFDAQLCVEYTDSAETVFGTPELITDNYSSALSDAQIVIVTLPAFLMPSFARQAADYLSTGTILIAMPGYGGVEFIFRDMIRKGVILVGFQRVPAVYRLKEYGRHARLSGRRPALHFAALPAGQTKMLQPILEDVFSMPCIALQNFLAVTLTPSNPILHTTRLYSLFRDLPADGTLEENPLFYGEWSPLASHWLFGCDTELQMLLQKIPLDLHEVVSLKIHYESDTEQALTEKMRSIRSLHSIRSPMISENGRYRVDWDSRYFLADFPYGLAILKAIAVLYALPTPCMDTVLSWYAAQRNLEYYLSNGNFTGKDLSETGIPQNYGIHSAEEFIRVYQ